MTAHEGFRLSVALNGAGSHPAAPARQFTPEAYASLVRGAEAGLLDFITVEDGPGRLDSALLLALAATVTDRIGLVPLGPATGDPEAWAARIATLDHLSAGRAGVRPRAATSTAERARLVALYGTPEGDRELAELFGQAGEFLDAATQAWGTAVRPVQGRPPLAVLAHATIPYRLAAAHADVVFVTPKDTAGLVTIRKEVEALREEAGRPAGHCGSSPTSRSYWAPARRRPTSAGPGWTRPRASRSSRTRRSSRVLRKVWPTSSRSGSAKGAPTDSGCGPPYSPTTSTRSPPAWCPSCSGAGSSAPSTPP